MLRWLIVGLLVAGCGIGVDRFEKPGASGFQQFHDYSACGGGMNFPTAATDHCMERRGYRVKDHAK